MSDLLNKYDDLLKDDGPAAIVCPIAFPSVFFSIRTIGSTWHAPSMAIRIDPSTLR